jgi:cytochrome c
VAALALPPRPVSGEDLTARGRAVFDARCASCHALEAGRDGLPGPNLAGLVGRGVAGDSAFDYSPALEAARGRAAWNTATLDRFLADPEAMFPGLWMGENGVRDAAERAAVVRFLTGGG